jgi:hypothetical protein
MPFLSPEAAANLPPGAFEARLGKVGPDIDLPADVRARLDSLWRGAQRLPETPTFDDVAELYDPVDLAKLRAMSPGEFAKAAEENGVGVPLLPRESLGRPLADFRLERVEFDDEHEGRVTPVWAVGVATADGVSIRFFFERQGVPGESGKYVYRPWFFATWARVDKR